MPTATYWDTQNQRSLSDSAAQTIMAPFAHELLRRARSASLTITLDDLSRLLQRRSGIEVREAGSGWLPSLLHRVDERCAQVGEEPLSPVVSVPSAPSRPERKPAGRARTSRTAAAPRATAKPTPLEGSICPRCFMQMSLTGVCDNCE